MMKRILGYIILLIVALALAAFVHLLRELIPEVVAWHIELMLAFLEIGLFLGGIIAAIYGFIRWRRIPDSMHETAKWYRQFKGRREMARCPGCESLNIGFQKASPVPSDETGEMKWKAVCYDCGRTWEMER